MARSCLCCAHPDRDSIDAAIVAHAESLPVIGERYGISSESVRRHRDNHLSPSLRALRVQVQDDKRAALVDRIETLIVRGEAMFSDAAGAGQSAQALNILRELRAQIELLGKATGELDDRPQVTINLLTHPEVLAALNVVYTELADLPDVRQRIAARLQPDRLAIEAAP